MYCVLSDMLQYEICGVHPNDFFTFEHYWHLYKKVHPTISYSFVKHLGEICQL